MGNLTRYIFPANGMAHGMGRSDEEAVGISIYIFWW